MATIEELPSDDEGDKAEAEVKNKPSDENLDMKPSTSGLKKSKDGRMTNMRDILAYTKKLCSEPSDSEDESDDMPELEEVPDDKPGTSGGPEFVPVARQSRGEKKARRLLMKLDLKPVENVSRVCIRKAKNILLCIDNPDVFKCPHNDTYICFGDIRVEDMNNTATTQAAERFRMNTELNMAEPKREIPAIPDADGNEHVDSQGLDEKDIELVQMQANCTRKQAINALLSNENDVVNAIMQLTLL